MDMTSGCRSADQPTPNLIHGNHGLRGIQDHRAETYSRAGCWFWGFHRELR